MAAPQVRKTTLKDVANLCGVSPMTVSKMLNGKGGVSKETSQRVWKAIRQLNYTPNMIAKSLRMNRTFTFGVVTSDSSELLFSKMISGIIEAATANDYSIIIANSKQDQKREDEAIRVLLNKRIDGLLLAAPFRADMDRFNEILSFGIPVALLMRATRLPVDFVASDNRNGGYHLVQYLIDTLDGRSPDFYFINLPREHYNGIERFQGELKCLQDNRIALDDGRTRFVKPQIADGYAAMQDLMRKGLCKGTLVCGSDVVAVGAIQAALDAGLSVPGDIRVTGYDDIELLDYLHVPLTTMRQQVYRMGAKGVEILMQRMAHSDHLPKQSRLSCELIVRKST